MNIIDDEVKKVSIRQIEYRIIEDFIIIWLDSNINNSEKIIQQQFQYLVNTIKFFNNFDECYLFLINIKHRKIFLILEINFQEIFLSKIHDLSQLDSIFIFSNKKLNINENLKQKWFKIQGIFNDISLIYKQLKNNIRQCQQNIIPISIISSSYLNINLNELDPSFMYSKLLKEILLKIQYNDKSKLDFIEFCRIQYANNNYQLNKINDFEKNYYLHSSIWWYTKETFIYSILNNALRIQDIEIIINMGYFIRDLHQEIERLYLQSNMTDTFIVYRGQGMLIDEFEKLKQSKGGLLSFNNFLSTSLNRDVSLLFANNVQINPNLIGILFEMEINPLISSLSPFVFLNNISHYPDEEEVLFSMHTIFRINEIEKIDDYLWKINLILTNDNDQQLINLTEQIRNEIKEEIEWDQLGSLMIQMGEFNKAKDIYQTLLNTTTLNNDLKKLNHLQYKFGLALYHTGDLKDSLLYLEKSLQIRQESFPFNYTDLTINYRSIGNIHSSMGNYLLSLEYYEKAREIQEKYLSSDYLQLAIIYNNIGWTYYLLNQYNNALLFCEKAIDFEKKSLPLNHSLFSYTYDTIGKIYNSMKNYSKALEYYSKVFEIQRKSLQLNHPLLAETYCSIGEVYYSIENYLKALEYYEKTLEIRLKSFVSNHPDIGYIYKNIGQVYYSIEKYSIAFEYYNKAIDIQQISLPSNHPNLAITYINIADVYYSIKNFLIAFSFYEKALKIQEISLPSNHHLLTVTHYKISLVLENLEKYNQAIEHIIKAIEILKSTIEYNHLELEKYQNYYDQLSNRI